MSTRTKILVVLAGVLALTYVYFFSGLYTPHDIRIVVQLRSNRPAGNRRPPRDTASQTGVYPVLFGFDKPYNVTSIQVFTVSDLEFAKDAAKPLWSLVPEAADKPVPLSTFHYGDRIRGMVPADANNAKPAPLLPETQYRLLVRAGKVKGQTDFRTLLIPPSAAPAR